jgi:hypothetical protein
MNKIVSNNRKSTSGRIRQFVPKYTEQKLYLMEYTKKGNLRKNRPSSIELGRRKR